MSKMEPPQGPPHDFHESNRRSLIYWVNSFNNPYCLIASTSTDFKDGIVLCELVSALKGTSILHDSQKAFPSGLQSSLRNIQAALSGIRTCVGINIPRKILELQPEDIYDSEDNLFDFLEFLKAAFESKKKGGMADLEDAYFSLADPAPVSRIGEGPSKFYQEKEPSPETRVLNPVSPFQVESGNRNPEPFEILREPLECKIVENYGRQQSENDTPRLRHEEIPRRNMEENRPLQMRNMSFKESKDDKTDIKVKQKVLAWLEQINLIKHGVVEADAFPGYCRNGVLLSDLIHRLEGRQSELKGINRNPKTKTAILSNLKKCLDHLRRYERINSRYLWSIQEIFSGNPDVIWGLLHDMYHVFHVKLGPTKVQRRVESTVPTPPVEVPQKPVNRIVAQPSRRQEFQQVQDEFYTVRPTPIAPYPKEYLQKSPHETQRKQQSNQSYSQIHARSPIHANYYAGSNNLRQKLVTPSNSRARKQHNTVSVQRYSANTSQFLAQDSSTHSTIQSPKSGKSRNCFALQKLGERNLFPKVKEEDEKLTRGWLKLLNFTTTRSQENEVLLKNPFRNGTLLCEILEILEKTVLRAKIKNPSTLSQAYSNVVLALEVLGQLQPGKLPGYYTNYDKVAEKVLRGDRDVIWGLLSIIREMYPQTDQQSRVPLHLLNTGLPYSLTEIIALEKSLIRWLQSLQLIKGESERLSLLDIEQKIRAGGLLCELAVILHRNRVKPHGIIPEPRSAATALSNLRKAFELFRQLPRICRRYLWCEKEVLNGDRGVILGLLEDLHRFYDGYIGERGSSLTPYYGKYKSVETRPKEEMTRTPVSPGRYDEAPPELKDNCMEGTFESNKVDVNEVPLIAPSVIPIPHPCPVNPTTTKSFFKYTRESDIEPVVGISTSTILRSTPQNYSEINYRGIGKSESVAEFQRETMNEMKILDWIRKLGLKVPKTESLSGSLFKNGVLLAEVVETLERRRIEGINENPKSSASALHNIRKVLEVLKRKKSIPIKYLYSEVEIYKGQKEVIMGLLNSIKLAYPSVVSPKRYCCNNIIRIDRTSYQTTQRGSAFESRRRLINGPYPNNY